MTTESAPIFDAALGLLDPLRADVAAQLLASLDASAKRNVDDAVLEDELARRQQSLCNGTAKTYSADETIAAMRGALAKRIET